MQESPEKGGLVDEILTGHATFDATQVDVRSAKPGDVITDIGYQYAVGGKIVKLERVILSDGKENFASTFARADIWRQAFGRTNTGVITTYR